jgi:hypothetical protein
MRDLKPIIFKTVIVDNVTRVSCIYVIIYYMYVYVLYQCDGVIIESNTDYTSNHK